MERIILAGWTHGTVGLKEYSIITWPTNSQLQKDNRLSILFADSNNRLDQIVSSLGGLTEGTLYKLVLMVVASLPWVIWAGPVDGRQ